jgi:predicted  nucleic acid-binding Zn-ribbon protein
MNDVRQLLKTKVNIETAMQRADPLMRLVMQRQLDVVCGEIEKAREEWHKGERGAGMSDVINTDLLEENDALKNRIAELEREVQDYKEENVKLLQQCLSLYRAVKKANVELDKIEKSCDNNVWFQKIKERTY